MDDAAKIHLSSLEKAVVLNTEWIFTKQRIMEKVHRFFGELHQVYEKKVALEKRLLPSIFMRPGGKVTKGENYAGLPYMILDYPACFSKDRIFAVRTFFWWGNFFSISLHVSGSYLESRKNITGGTEWLREHNFFVCVNEREWEHHFEPSNFRNANEMQEHELTGENNKGFLKIARKIGVERWEEAPEFLANAFNEIIEFVKISFPGGEKVL